MANFFKKYKNYDKYEKLLFCGVVLQIMLLFVANLTQIEKWVDFDSGMAIKHAVEMWRCGSIVVPGHSYTTSMEVDCAGFFAAPIYMATRNLSFSIGIVQVVLISLFLYVLLKVLKYLNATTVQTLLAVLLIFTPYQMGQLAYTNMLFFSVGQFEIRLIACLCVLAIVLRPDKLVDKEYISILILSIFSVGITSLSVGFSYLSICVFIPAFLALAVKIINEKSFTCIPKINVITLIILFVLCLIAGLYIVINHIPVNVHNHIIVPDYEFIENMWDVVLGIFLLFGGIYINKYNLASVEGISLIIHFAFVILLIGIIIRFFGSYKTCKNDAKKNKIFFWFTFFILVVNNFVFILTDVRTSVYVFPARYHLIWVIPVLIAVAVSFTDFANKIENSWWKHVLYFVLTSFIIVLNTIGFGIIYFYDDDDNVNVEAFAHEYADEYKADKIYVSDEHLGRIILGMDLDHTVIPIRCDNRNVSIERWGIATHEISPENSMWLVKTDVISEYPESFKEDYYIVGTYNEWSIYCAK